MVQYCGSLVGKEFRVVLQAAPFILFPYISQESRHVWTLLAHLGSYIFQTKITNKEKYLSELKVVTNQFLNTLIHQTAQWTNKPKVHMLTHLAYSIQRFGPASLFSTEKEESYNGNVREASVHSNRQSPGRDIANTFNDLRLLKTLLTGSYFHDSKLKVDARAGPGVLKFFSIPEIQKGLGWNPDWDKERLNKIHGQHCSVNLLTLGHCRLTRFE